MKRVTIKFSRPIFDWNKVVFYTNYFIDLFSQFYCSHCQVFGMRAMESKDFGSFLEHHRRWSEIVQSSTVLIDHGNSFK